MSGDGEGLPYVLIEQLVVGGQEIVRVVGWTHDESEAHSLGSTMARAGCRVWMLDLWGDSDGPTVSRYPGPAAAVWANEHGADLTTPEGVNSASEAGK